MLLTVYQITCKDGDVLLQPKILETVETSVENRSRKGYEVRIEVRHGDPPGTTLFSSYMDVYSGRIMRNVRHYRTAEKGMIMFADDVKL